MSTLENLRKQRLGNQENVESIKEELLREQNAYQLHELHEQ